MKLVGVTDPLGYSPLKDSIGNGPESLNLIYQDEQGTYYIKYVDVGGFPFLIEMLKKTRNPFRKRKELDCYLNQKSSIASEFPYQYGPIKNEWVYYSFTPETTIETLENYSAIKDFSCATVEEFSEDPAEDNRRAVLFPNKELYVGRREFLYQNAGHNLSIEGRSVPEIKAIIYWLVQNMFLEEAYSLIKSIKASGNSLREYQHPKYLFVSDGSKNFLDQELIDIKALQYVRKRTKPIQLRIFD